MCNVYPIFASDSSKVAVGFFYLFVSSGSRICPNRAGTQLLLVSYTFFAFCCWRGGVSRYKHCSTEKKGPLSHLFWGLLPIPTLFTFNGSLNLWCALLYGNPYKGHVLFFLTFRT